ncbi:hypothetical protein D5086_027219 [Populus alba]
MAGAFALWIGWLGVYLGVHGEGRVMHAFLRVAFKVGPATFPVGAPGPCCCTRLGWTLGLDLCMGGVQLSSSPIGCMPRGRGIVCSVIQLLAAYVDSVHVLSSWLFPSHG